MSAIRRILRTFFSALPAAVYFILAVTDDGMRGEYYQPVIIAAVTILFGSALLLGAFQPGWLFPKWFWILAVGLVSMLLTLFTTVVLNATPLCVGQNNGDGNNDLERCMGHCLLYAIFYGIPYVVMLGASASFGHWILKHLP